MSFLSAPFSLEVSEIAGDTFSNFPCFNLSFLVHWRQMDCVFLLSNFYYNFLGWWIFFSPSHLFLFPPLLLVISVTSCYRSDVILKPCSQPSPGKRVYATAKVGTWKFRAEVVAWILERNPEFWGPTNPKPLNLLRNWSLKRSWGICGMICSYSCIWNYQGWSGGQRDGELE